MLVFLELPHSRIKVRVPVFRQHNTVVREDPRFVEFGGLRPDMRVEATAEDVAAGRDVVLAAALQGSEGRRD